MLVANTQDLKDLFVNIIRLAKMPFKYDLVVNIIISLKFRFLK